LHNRVSNGAPAAEHLLLVMLMSVNLREPILTLHFKPSLEDWHLQKQA